jgi:hypothetical protein
VLAAVAAGWRWAVTRTAPEPVREG